MSTLKKSEFESQKGAPQGVLADIFQRLLKSGVFRRVSAFDSDDVYQEPADNVTVRVRFVGVIFYRDVFLTCLPKYLAVTSGIAKHDRLEMSLISEVLRKVQRESVLKSEFSPGDIGSNDSLSLTLEIIEHFEKFGLYTETRYSATVNGNGSIDWNSTILLSPPHIVDGVPIYVNVKTRQLEVNRTSHIARLHSAILGFCSRLLNESKMSYFVDIFFEYDSHEILEDFSDIDFILYEIEQEKRVQFVTWKAELLELLASFVRMMYNSSLGEELYYFGTQTFNLVWETACKTVFNDKSQDQIAIIDDSVGIPESWKRFGRLRDMIPRPEWSNEDATLGSSAGTLIPDIISFHEDREQGLGMCILDAKYYTPTFEDGASGAPGLESITKQFLYQRAYKEFVVASNIAWMKNVFIFPIDSDRSEYYGRVSFAKLFDEKPPLSRFIDAVSVPARIVLSAYLEERTLMEELLFGCSVNLMQQGVAHD